jgi:hypothetical protein
MTVSESQMKRLEAVIMCYVAQVIDETDGSIKQCYYGTVADQAGSTSRPPQPLKGRKVTHRCRDGPAVKYVDVGELPSDEAAFSKPAPRSEPTNTKDGDCSRSMYEDCSSDARYNPEVSPNLKAVAPIWNAAEGYFIGSMKSFDANGLPLAEVFASDDIANTFPYPQQEVRIFVNRTIQETRLYEHNYRVHKAATAAFCALPVPSSASDVKGAGECGTNGYAVESEIFGTAAFEKDGSANIIMASGIYAGATSGKAIPVGSNSFYKSIASDTFQKVETSTFSNEEMTQITGSGQFFILSDSLPYSENPLYASYTFVLEQVSKEMFEAELAMAYTDANIIEEERPPVVQSGNCVFEDACPSEEMFAKMDPALAESPYQEKAKVKAGFIALFVIISITVLMGAALFLHKMQLDSQSNRYREVFAKRIAETIEFTGKHGQLTPESLEDEFRRMDIDGDGKVSKEDMRQFMGDKMSAKDFEAMFIAMDIDHNGTVEFAEFCSFMTHVFSAFDKANASGSRSVAAAVPETVSAPEPVSAPEADAGVVVDA